MTIVEKHGLAALTYESLAAESGLSKSGLIYYFPSRQTLLLEINRFLAAQWEEKMVELAGGPAHEVGKQERIRASFLVMSQSATLADLRMTLDAADNPEMLQPWLDVMPDGAPHRTTPTTTCYKSSRTAYGSTTTSTGSPYHLSSDNNSLSKHSCCFTPILGKVSFMTTNFTGQRTDKTTVVLWSLWDLGSAAFNAVLITFVFSVYLTDSVGKTIDSRFTPTTWLAIAIGIGGMFIALLAPVIGQRSDARGTRRRSVRVWTLITIAIMLSLYFIRNDDPIYFWLGITILAIGSVTYELGEVSYFAMLNQVSTEKNVGRVSGFGWALGYFGGIFLLLICYFGFIADDGGYLHISTEGGLNVRLVAIMSALWFLVFGLPVMFRVPEIAPNPNIGSDGFVESYKELWHTLRHLWRKDRSSVFFLISSAIFRDGLAGVFTFGAILAVSVYELDAGDVLIFGIAANLISALGAVVCGYFDDIFGPKPVIMVSLVSMIAMCFILYFVSGPTNFWIYGLILTLFVGPAQSSSRTFLSRMAPPGYEGQMFGLYATTGRAVSWMAPAAFSLFSMLFGGDRAGIFGIAVILLAGALVLMKVKEPTKVET